MPGELYHGFGSTAEDAEYAEVFVWFEKQKELGALCVLCG
jgi:hypothetical protein